MNPRNHWPLKGKTVVVTRAQERQGEAQALFTAQQANILDLPALVIGPPDEWGPLDDALAELESFHWVVFSSSNGVLAVEERLRLLGKDLASRPMNLKIAAVGRKTARTLEEIGSSADFVPPNFVADSLIQHFPVSGWGLKMLLPRVQSGGRTILAEAFGEAGARVVEVAAYESSCPPDIPEITANALVNKKVDAITFTSGKTVANTFALLKRHFGDDWHKTLDGVKLLSIGPQTSNSCKKYFDRVDEEANPHDLDGLVNACLKAFTESV